MSITSLCAACSSCFLLTLFACGFLRAFAIRRALVDVPNERSLHRVPVPRLGGVGITLGVWLATAAVAVLPGHRTTGEITVWLVASLVTAGTGFIDDLRPLRARARLMIQFGIAAAVVMALQPPPRLVLAEGVTLTLPGWVLAPMWMVGIVGVLNIYNFMDGMDGLAAAQGIGAGLSVAAALASRGHVDLALVGLFIAAACAGFFIHNVGPARLFMGDAGSTMLGFSFAWLALAGQTRADPLPLPVVPLSLAPFLLDGTFTLFRRAFRGEAVWKAHRTHLYQRAVTAGLSHREVLAPYAGWMALAGGTAALASRAGSAIMLALVCAMLLSLGAVWRWVVRLEQRKDET